jgi:hypothetical protein
MTTNDTRDAAAQHLAEVVSAMLGDRTVCAAMNDIPGRSATDLRQALADYRATEPLDHSGHTPGGVVAGEPFRVNLTDVARVVGVLREPEHLWCSVRDCERTPTHTIDEPPAPRSVCRYHFTEWSEARLGSPLFAVPEPVRTGIPHEGGISPLCAASAERPFRYCQLANTHTGDHRFDTGA